MENLKENIEELKNLLNELEAAEQEANEADAEWEKNPESETLETAFDEAYTAEWEAFNKVKEKLMSFGVEEGTAARMIKSQREALKKIINRAQ